MRIFLAFGLPANIKKMCVDLQQKLKSIFGSNVVVKWVEPENLHVTLAFLGELKVQQLERLIARLEIIDGGGFYLGVDRLNWPGYGRIPKVLWIALKSCVSDNDPCRGRTVDKLYLKIQNVLNSLNIVVNNREYIPHITLGRVKRVKVCSSLSGDKLLEFFKKDLSCKFKVDSFHVMSSVLTPKGPIYKLVKTVKL